MTDARDDIRRYLCSMAVRGNNLLYRSPEAVTAGEEEPEQPARKVEEKKPAAKIEKKEKMDISNIETGIVFNTVEAVQDRLFAEQGASAEHDLSGDDMKSLAGKVEKCALCPLSKSRTRTVFGAGDPRAGIVFVGEAPGREEDLSGLPFVGRAGKLLDRILAAMDFSREEVYIANILKCRPPDNRDPREDEVAACEPFLQKQLELMKPEVICALGRVAAQTLLRTKSSLSRMRGRIHYYNGVKLIATYHPAALLRNPHFKRPAWEDMKLLRAIYDGKAD